MSEVLKSDKPEREFGTGAIRDNAEGKGRFDLVPWTAIWDLAKYQEVASKRYPSDNWRHGIPLRTFLDSALRHLIKLTLGMQDEDHWAAAMWNLTCMRETYYMVKLGKIPQFVDDPKNPGKQIDLLDLPAWFDMATVTKDNRLVLREEPKLPAGSPPL